MGTRCLTVVMDGNKEILCMYRQMDGYLEGHGAELVEAFKGFQITNGIARDATKTANGMGCFAAQLVAFFKRADGHGSKGSHDLQVGQFYLYAPETREVGEEYIYRLSVKAEQKTSEPGTGKLWLDISEGEVAYFGAPGTKPELMEWLYSGWLDDFDPAKEHGEVYHAKVG